MGLKHNIIKSNSYVSVILVDLFTVQKLCTQGRTTPRNTLHPSPKMSTIWKIKTHYRPQTAVSGKGTILQVCLCHCFFFVPRVGNGVSQMQRLADAPRVSSCSGAEGEFPGILESGMMHYGSNTPRLRHHGTRPFPLVPGTIAVDGTSL